MSKETGIILLGVLVLITPYLGIPGSWKTLLLLLAGVAIMLVGFLMRGETLSRGVEGSESHPFVESPARKAGHDSKVQ